MSEVPLYAAADIQASRGRFLISEVPLYVSRAHRVNIYLARPRQVLGSYRRACAPTRRLMDRYPQGGALKTRPAHPGPM